MIIKILGSGCKSCKKLEANAKEAVDDLGKSAEFIKVDDYADIAAYNVMKTPALVIDEKLVSFGKVNSVAEIKAFLE